MKDFYIIFSFFLFRFFLPQYIPIFYKDVPSQTIKTILFLLCDILFILGIWTMCYITNKKYFKNTGQDANTNASYFYGLSSISNKKNISHTRSKTYVNILLGILVYVLLLTLGLLNNIPSTYKQNITQTFLFSSNITKHLLLLLVIMFAAFSEELFYRSYILRRLTSLHMPTTIVILSASLLFAISHTVDGNAPLETQLKIFVFSFSSGILLSILMILRRSLLANYLAHVLYNISVYLILQKSL